MRGIGIRIGNCRGHPKSSSSRGALAERVSKDAKRRSHMALQPRQLLLDMLQAAIVAALPEHCVPPHLPPPPKGRTIVVGAGKGSAAMARAVEQHWPKRGGKLSGLIVTRYGHAVPTTDIEVVEAGHPVPDEAGRAAAARILDMVQGLTADDLVLCLVSGGGSALLTLPAPGLTLADKQAVNKA